MPTEPQNTVPDHVSENIEAVLALRAESERRVHRSQRAIEALTWSLGKPRTLYVLLLGAFTWIAYNLFRAASGGRPFDPAPFFYLQGLITLYAAIMTTIILITQNRQSKEVERNAHLELQVNLLAEQRTAKIIALLEELRRDLPNVRDRVDPIAEALQQAVPPTAVSTALEHTLHPNEHDSDLPHRLHLPSSGS